MLDQSYGVGRLDLPARLPVACQGVRNPAYIDFAMERAPLDSLKCESTYLELRPEGERASATMDTPASAELGATTRENTRLPETAGISEAANPCVGRRPAPRTHARRASSRY